MERNFKNYCKVNKELIKRRVKHLNYLHKRFWTGDMVDLLGEILTGFKSFIILLLTPIVLPLHFIYFWLFKQPFLFIVNFINWKNEKIAIKNDIWQQIIRKIEKEENKENEENE